VASEVCAVYKKEVIIEFNLFKCWVMCAFCWRYSNFYYKFPEANVKGVNVNEKAQLVRELTELFAFRDSPENALL